VPEHEGRFVLSKIVATNASGIIRQVDSHDCQEVIAGCMAKVHGGQGAWTRCMDTQGQSTQAEQGKASSRRKASSRTPNNHGCDLRSI